MAPGIKRYFGRAGKHQKKLQDMNYEIFVATWEISSLDMRGRLTLMEEEWGLRKDLNLTWKNLDPHPVWRSGFISVPRCL